MTLDVLPGAEKIPVAELRGVTRKFTGRPALDNVTISLGKAEILGLIGRSGAGKSTLIRCLNGLDRPDEGHVIVDGLDITTLPERKLQPVRRRIGMIFQHFNLLQSRSVLENIELPLKIAGVPKTERRRRASDLLELVGLADKAQEKPARLSGGQKQRVGIARALAAAPVLLLCDEATSALDPETTQAILELLGTVNQELGLTILMITHEIDVIRQIAHRVVVIDNGRVVEQGPVANVLADPRHDVTKSLVRGLVPALPPSIRDALTISGQAVVQIDLLGDRARLPILSLLQEATGIAPCLLHGGVSEVRGTPWGRLFVGLGTASPEKVAAANRVLEPISIHHEVIGHVQFTC